MYLLADLTKLEVGSESKTNLLSNAGVNFLKSPKRETPISPVFFMRVHVQNLSGEIEVLQFRSTKLRFFNNMAVPICKTEDMNGNFSHFSFNLACNLPLVFLMQNL